MTTYYVRPDTSHSVSRDGLTYETAWGGWGEIVWGALGVKGGDTLYICGSHSILTTIQMGDHGATVSNRVTISGGYVPDPGSITITGAGGVFFFVHRSYTTIEDLSITANQSNCFYNYPTTGVTYQRCTLTGGNGGAIIGISAATGQVYNDMTFTDNAFIGGTGSPLGGAISWTVAASGSPISNLNRITITGNTFDECDAGRAVVQLRLEDGANASANMTDIIVTNNIFRNCTTLGMEIIGPSATGFPEYYGRNTGIRITGNKFYNMTQTDAEFNLGGAMGIGGFAPSLTVGFGDNIIAWNEAYNITGPSGFLNLFYGTFQVFENYAEDIIASQADGNAILVDHGCDNVVIYRNKFKRVIGNAATENSGCGIMILNATNVTAYSNLVDGCKIGIYIGNKGTAQSCDLYNNTFRDCSYAGILILSTADVSTLISRNNLCTATGVCPSVKNSSTAWAGESYNCFHSFTAPIGHSLAPTTLTTDPALDERHSCSSGTVIGKGTSIGSYADVYGRAFKSTPSIGAVEAVTKDLYRTLRGT